MNDPDDGLDPGRRTGPRRWSRPRRVGDQGRVEVFVSDEQDDVVVDVARYRELSHHVLDAEGVRGECELGLLFVDGATIAHLNGTHMGADGPTDVLAFPIDDEFPVHARAPADTVRAPAGRDPVIGRGPLLLGDVVVCPAVAGANAAANEGSYPGHRGVVDDELDLLVVHGILHVLGMDHAADDERRAMQVAERQHLAGFGATMTRAPASVDDVGDDPPQP